MHCLPIAETFNLGVKVLIVKSNISLLYDTLDIVRLTVYNICILFIGGIAVDYISPKEAAEKWGISERRIQKLCEEKRIDGATRFSRVWVIPKDAKKPEDKRYKNK